jgi:bifunctional DNA-binding transcriptional regulator/antitoxin component of YhaV-PrlF toxin-antitoxin module
MIRHFIDISDVVVIPEEDRESMGAENGAGILEIFMKDGTVLKEIALRPSGLLIGYETEMRTKKMYEAVEAKCDMLERAYGIDLSSVDGMVNNLEGYTGRELIDAIQTAVSGG